MRTKTFPLWLKYGAKVCLFLGVFMIFHFSLYSSPLCPRFIYETTEIPLCGLAYILEPETILVYSISYPIAFLIGAMFALHRQ